MKNEELTIIAGPCSVDIKNLEEIYQIADLEVTNRKGKKQKAIAGTRIVGIKSRTDLNAKGEGMGIDYDIFQRNLQMLIKGGCLEDLEIPPSVTYSEEVQKKTNMIIATEVMAPLLQLPQYEGKIPKRKFMPWNPAVEQLGWPIHQLGEICKKNGWHVGLKNGKWIGEHIHSANSEDFKGQTTMEKTWTGLASYAGDLNGGDIVLIHRGVDVPDKGKYRNTPVHNIALRAKKKIGAKLYFDPSHSFGPQMKEQISYAVIDAMKMKDSNKDYVYNGILIETGTSKTDTEQHISISELQNLVDKIATFRDLVAPSHI